MSQCVRCFASVMLIATAAAGGGCDPTGGPPASPPVAVVASSVTGDSWWFRGTPNSWGTTAMSSADGTTFTICQTFAGIDNPRFKIDHHGDWAESYPAQDFAVANGSYQISFSATSKQITTQSVASCTGGGGDSW